VDRVTGVKALVVGVATVLSLGRSLGAQPQAAPVPPPEPVRIVPATPANPGDPPVVEGALVSGPRLALSAAVDSMLRASPEVQRSVAVVTQNRGVLQEASGAFDRTFSVTSALNYNRLDLTPSKIETEVDRRLQLGLPADDLDQVAAQIAAHVPSSGSLLFSSCATTNTVVEVQVGNGQPPVFICFDANNQVVGFVLNNQTIGLGSINSSALDRLLLFNALQHSGLSISLDTQEVLDGFDDLLNFLSRQLHLAASSLRLQFDEAGPIPEEEDTIDFETQIAYQWRFRNGLSVTPMLSLRGIEDHYGGKSQSPIFGDTTIPNLQIVTLGLTLDVPFAKNFGGVAVDAPERAARENLKAARDLVEHTASEQTLALTESYLSVAQAEDHLRLQLASQATQQRIYDGTVQLQRGDEATSLDVKRAISRLAQTNGAVATARQALVQARLSLQQVMGQQPSDAGQAPLPLETLSELLGADPPDNLDPEILIRQALMNRRDLRAAEEQTAANKLLAAAARHNLLPQIDLALNASYNGVHESTRDRWFDLGAYSAATSGPFGGPSYSATLNFAIPVQNNVARGQFAQADSTLAATQIQQVDLRRTIRVAVIELLGELRRSRRTLDLAGQAKDFQDQTLQASIDRFRGGDLSVIDTLKTEQDATTARLNWIDALANHLNLVAQLRFQMNVLLAGPKDGDRPQEYRLLPLSAPLG
jgi:outer membrane protein